MNKNQDFIWINTKIKGLNELYISLFISFVSNDSSVLSGYVIYKESLYFAFISENSRIKQLEGIGGLESCILDTSDNGVYVGWVNNEEGLDIPTYWTKEGKINIISKNEGKANVISPDGKYIAGFIKNSDNDNSCKNFIYDINSRKLTILDDLFFANCKYFIFTDVNSSYNMVGYMGIDDPYFDHPLYPGYSVLPFMYINKKLIILEEDIKGGQFRGISDNNEIVGYIINNKYDCENAIIYKNSKINYIFPQNIQSGANFISRDGKVIGGYFFGNNNYQKPFLYINNKIIDLEKEYKNYLKEGSYLVNVYNISSNNIYVIGVGYNSETQIQQPFVVNISKFLI
jgi:probable HAF family extracellular repeat protein